MRVFLRASTIALATSLILAGTAGAQASQSPPAPAKIGYINSAQLLAQAPGRARHGVGGVSVGGAPAL